ncbi:DUF4097 family beta strand repeat-containing protein [Nicoliella lavandulae]|uniref:DUF4097 family beta strand repeat-containing protein n=1 Tax=Nicoliella lavandulae TaxID=3082954 RepID=A0ABU8SMP1_9LACO
MKRIKYTGILLIIIGFIISIFSFTQVKDKFSSINQLIQSIQQESYGKTYEKRLSHFNQIQVNSDMDVQVKYGNRFKVIGVDAKNHQTDYHVENNKLIINGKKHESLFSNFKLIDFGDAEYNAKITIVIPKDTKLTSYQQNNSAYDLTMDGIVLSNKLALNNIDDVNLNHVTADGLSLYTSDGDINIKNSRFKQSASDLHTDDGDISVSDSQFKQLDLSSDDGDLRINNNIINDGSSRVNIDDGDIILSTNNWNTLSLSSSDGDVSFKHQIIKHNLDAKTEDGDIRGTVKLSDYAKITSNTQDGDVRIPSKLNQQMKTSKNYSFHTDDGDIDISEY